MITLCANCRKIKNQDTGEFEHVMLYGSKRNDISHGICPECARELYPELYDDMHH